MRAAVLLAVVLAGCGARISPDGSGSGNDQLGGVEADAVVDTGPGEQPPPPKDAGSAPDVIVEPTPTIGVDEITFIEVDEPAVGRRIRLEASCRITDHNGLDAFALPKNCSETLAIAVDPTTYGCGPQGGAGTVTVTLKDGRAYVRDLAADRCSVVIPSVRTHKAVYAAWYSAGGRG